ncbi:unnamed protein product [Amoebophrya sp. A25]|nr:unnamed protein product [Amoebophrya sp. A25]|eukprot:GSA25T00025522001.1
MREGITHVVVCHPSLPFAFERRGITYHRCPVLDTPTFELKPIYDPALEFIHETQRKKKKVLVHCQKGISRSTALVVAYIMKHGWDGRGGNGGAADRAFETVFAQVEKRRPVAFPNIGFQEQLRLYFSGQFSQTTIVGNVKRLIELKFDEAEDRVEALMDPTSNTSETGARTQKTKFEALMDTVVWKRIGLFFENLHKYEFVDEFVEVDKENMDVAKLLMLRTEQWQRVRLHDKNAPNPFDQYESPLIVRGNAAVKKLLAVEKVLAPTLDGVKMAKALANEINSWLKLLSDEERMQKRVRQKKFEDMEKRRQSEERRDEKRKLKKEPMTPKSQFSLNLV